MLTVSRYGISNEVDFLIIVPHAGEGSVFFRRFTEIKRHPEVVSRMEMFCDFIKLEQDLGATVMAHKIARALSKIHPRMGITLLEIDYPRGLLDGGRQMSHCIRPFLPADLLEGLRDDFNHTHLSCLDKIRSYLRLLVKNRGFFIDLHTMASHDPIFAKGPTQTFDWASMDEYIEGYRLGEQHGKQRIIDFIKRDDDGVIIADRKISECLEERFRGQYPFADSNPYRASKHFMMNEYMRSAPGIAIDFPKDLIFETSCQWLWYNKSDKKEVQYSVELENIVTLVVGGIQDYLES